ncbi:MAG: class I SAM-dependent methyltransferase [Hyphomicrobiaceae bacterium]|nr:class I SAM-dependent methyltransferase [Hyphomicrobiaceae bacterium]
MTLREKDHFSRVSHAYAESRPRYPRELFAWLAQVCSAHDLAWDCATGNGQAAVDLAPFFKGVVATDLSAEQIARAIPAPGVTYRAAPADASGLDDASVDLVTVAQALHWFDLDRFYAEVRRVVKPGGIVAVWTYGIHTTADAAIDARGRHFYDATVGPYWPPERHHVEAGYSTLPFPFELIAAPAFAMHADWSFAQLLGYLRSWSATGRFIREQGYDPVVALKEQIAPLWGVPSATRRITWPLTLLAGRLT